LDAFDGVIVLLKEIQTQIVSFCGILLNKGYDGAIENDVIAFRRITREYSAVINGNARGGSQIVIKGATNNSRDKSDKMVPLSLVVSEKDLLYVQGEGWVEGFVKEDSYSFGSLSGPNTQTSFYGRRRYSWDIDRRFVYRDYSSKDL
jgi:hypothetical protein